MKIGVPKESLAGEKRVAVVPETVAKLVKAKFDVVVQAGAGGEAGFADAAYANRGATVAESADVVYGADIIVRVNHPDAAEIARMRPGSALISFLWPAVNADTVKMLAERKITAIAMDRIPRIARAQSMDALSSMSSLAGYKCVIEAANALPQIFPLMMTAAGTIPATRVFVIGAGVAGLQAIATARRLGAIVEAYDVRPQVKEEVQSLGAKFVELPLDTSSAQDAGGYAKAQDEEFLKKQQELMAQRIAASDVVITTALIPGKKAPVLVTRAMLAGMKAGSVAVDLASEQGGNIEGSVAGRSLSVNGVTVIGMINVASELAHQSSQLYSRNVFSLLSVLSKDGSLALDPDDEIVRGTVVTREGKVLA